MMDRSKRAVGWENFSPLCKFTAVVVVASGVLHLGSLLGLGIQAANALVFAIHVATMYSIGWFAFRLIERRGPQYRRHRGGAQLRLPSPRLLLLLPLLSAFLGAFWIKRFLALYGIHDLVLDGDVWVLMRDGMQVRALSPAEARQHDAIILSIFSSAWIMLSSMVFLAESALSTSINSLQSLAHRGKA